MHGLMLPCKENQRDNSCVTPHNPSLNTLDFGHALNEDKELKRSHLFKKEFKMHDPDGLVPADMNS
jgi:hypothetical protein